MTTRSHSREELEGMTKADLVELAEQQGVEVTRGDGAEGDPVKADYVEALATADTASSSAPAVITSKSREKRADETIPGGSYIVKGKRVNASGEPIDESGKLLKPKREE
jgi:hypothetical protein